MKKEKKKRFVFSIPEELFEKLREYAEKNDLTIAQVVRRAIIRFLDKKKAGD